MVAHKRRHVKNFLFESQEVMYPVKSVFFLKPRSNGTDFADIGDTFHIGYLS